MDRGSTVKTHQGCVNGPVSSVTGHVIRGIYWTRVGINSVKEAQLSLYWRRPTYALNYRSTHSLLDTNSSSTHGFQIRDQLSACMRHAVFGHHGLGTLRSIRVVNLVV
jgi:hypothetical protein